jgi:RNA polymerase sigma-70 factor (ECF subfamily)
MNSEAAGYFPRVVRTAQEADRTEIRSLADGSVEIEPVALSAAGTVQAGDKAATSHPEFDISDEHLLAQVAEGEKEALSTLFRRHASIIRVLAERILRDASEAEDLVQEVFLFVFRKGALFDPERGSARSWLIQVAYHRAFDRRRYLASRRFYSNLELQEAIFRAEEPAVLTNSYEDSIEAALGRDALRRIDEALSEAQRLVIRLYFFDGHTLQEIAAVIGQSVGNVRNHYYRALEKMRKEVFTTKLQAK